MAVIMPLASTWATPASLDVHVTDALAPYAASLLCAPTARLARAGITLNGNAGGGAGGGGAGVGAGGAGVAAGGSPVPPPQANRRLSAPAAAATRNQRKEAGNPGFM
jgi:hypothetical protein